MKIIPKFLCLIFIILFKTSLAARHADIKVLPFEQGYTSFFPVNFRQSNSNTGPESTCDGKKDSSALLIFKKDINNLIQWDSLIPIKDWEGVHLTNGCVTKIILNDLKLEGKLNNDFELKSLEVLELNRNNLEGKIPSFSNCQNLKHLWLSENKFSEIDSAFKLEKLRSLNFSNNTLRGKLPNFNKSVKEVVLHNNKLNGNNNIKWTELKSLSWIRLDNNDLEFNNVEIESDSLRSLNLSKSKIKGTLKVNGKNLKHLIINDNELTTLHLPENGRLWELRMNKNQITDIKHLRLMSKGKAFLNNNQLRVEIKQLDVCDSIDVSNNKYSFEHLVPLKDVNYFKYAPQEKILKKDTIRWVQGLDTVSFDLEIDKDLKDNEYYWKRNGIDIRKVVGNNKLEFSSFNRNNDTGDYIVSVTNKLLTDLELSSHKITFKANFDKYKGNINATICKINSSYPFYSNKFIKDTVYTHFIKSNNLEKSPDSTIILSLKTSEPPKVKGKSYIMNCTLFAEVEGSEGQGKIKYKWENGETTMIAEKNLKPNVSYKVTVSDSFCTVDSAVNTIEFRKLEVKSTLNHPNCAKSNGSIQLVLSGSHNRQNVFWRDKDTSLFRSNLSAGEYGVTAKDGNGCSFDTTLILGGYKVFSTITPNDDGKNDYLRFVPLGSELELKDIFPDNELIIFNRWSDVIYRAKKYNNQWPEQQKLASGTYYYIFKDRKENPPCQNYLTILNANE